VLLVNLLAALAVVALLLGATAVLVTSRQAGAFTPEAYTLTAYGLGLLLGTLAFVLLRKLLRAGKRADTNHGSRLAATAAALAVGALLTAAAGYHLMGPAEGMFSAYLQEMSSSAGQYEAILYIAAGCVGMAVPLLIAALGSVLLGQNASNVINLITSISAFALGIGAAAVILVLSVFNGFEVVIADMFGKFNSAVKVTPARGKTFLADTLPLDAIRAIDGVEAVSLTLEETAFFEYGDARDFGKLRGVDSAYARVSDIDSTIVDGVFAVSNGSRALGVLGLGVRNKLDINVGDTFEPVQVYAAKRDQRGPLDRPFRVRSVYPVGTFAVQQEYDQQYMFTDIELVRQLLNAPGAASAIELSIVPTADEGDVAAAVSDLLGANYAVRDRMEQDADLLRLMNIEKWLGYLILTLVLLLISFNLVGGLWLVVSEKERDIGILRTMGASDAQLRGIFLGVGLLLAVMGVGIGLGLALLVYSLQVNYDLVTVPQGLVVSAYPIELRSLDVLVVAITVLVIGLLASVPAARRAVR